MATSMAEMKQKLEKVCSGQIGLDESADILYGVALELKRGPHNPRQAKLAEDWCVAQGMFLARAVKRSGGFIY